MDDMIEQAGRKLPRQIQGAAIVQVSCLDCQRHTSIDLRALVMIQQAQFSARRGRVTLRCGGCGSPAVRVREALC